MPHIRESTDAESGFYYGYIIVAGAFVIAAADEGLLFSFGVFFKPLLEEFGWTRSMTSGAFTLWSLLHIPGVFVVGKLTDRYGTRPMLTLCGLLLGLGYILMSRINALWQLYLFYGVVASIGQSFYWIPLIAIVPQWFVTKRALMMGLVSSGIGVGQMIFPPVASCLIYTYGWRTSYVVVGSVSMVVIMGCARLLKSPPTRGGRLASKVQNLEDGVSAHEPKVFSLRKALQTKPFWMVSVIFFAFLVGLGTVLVHSVIHAIELGMSAASAANILAILGITGIISRVVLGRLADYLGNKSVFVICSALMFLAFVWIAFAREVWMIYLFAVTFGVAYSALEVLHSPIIAELFGLSGLGTLSGASLAVGLIGFGSGPMLAGYIFDAVHSYQTAFLMCAVMALASLLAAMWLPGGSKEVPSS
jgi:MFS family permease